MVSLNYTSGVKTNKPIANLSNRCNGAFPYIAFCHVVRTTIKAKLQNAAWLLLFYEPRQKLRAFGCSWIHSGVNSMKQVPIMLRTITTVKVMTPAEEKKHWV